MKRTKFFILMVLICLCGNGCGSQDDTGNGQPKILTYQLPNAVVEEYGEKVTIPMEGVLGIPEGTKLPVMILLHGSYENTSDAKQKQQMMYDKLIELFTQKGYFTIAVDVSFAYRSESMADQMFFVQNILVSHMNALVDADMGKSMFEVNLRNKINFKQISVFAHEKGAEAALFMADNLVRQNLYLKSLVLFDPSAEYKADDIYFDVPTTILVSNGENLQTNTRDFILQGMESSKRKSPLFVLSFAKEDTDSFQIEEAEHMVAYTDSFATEYSKGQPLEENWLGDMATHYGDRVLVNYVP